MTSKKTVVAKAEAAPAAVVDKQESRSQVMAERWAKMTPEEKEVLKQKMAEGRNRPVEDRLKDVDDRIASLTAEYNKSLEKLQATRKRIQDQGTTSIEELQRKAKEDFDSLTPAELTRLSNHKRKLKEAAEAGEAKTEEAQGEVAAD